MVINRAAISEAPTDPTFAKVLAAKGRGSIVPKLERYLENQRERGRLQFEVAGAAVDALIGLVIGDRQVRRLLGVLEMPEPAQPNRQCVAFSPCSDESALLCNLQALVTYRLLRGP